MLIVNIISQCFSCIYNYVLAGLHSLQLSRKNLKEVRKRVAMN